MSIHCTDCGAVASYGRELAHKSGCPSPGGRVPWRRFMKTGNLILEEHPTDQLGLFHVSLDRVEHDPKGFDRLVNMAWCTSWDNGMQALREAQYIEAMQLDPKLD